MVAPPRDGGRLHLGVARVDGRADGRRGGQVSGSQIPYALATALAVNALVITIVGAPLVALPVPPLCERDDDLARRFATGARAVLLTVIAVAADRELRPAKRAMEESIVEHALAGRRLLALLPVSRDGALVDAPSRDTEGRESHLPAFVHFGARTVTS
jgi:hypothetical protein